MNVLSPDSAVIELKPSFTAADWSSWVDGGVDCIVASVYDSIVIFDMKLNEIRRFAFPHGKVHHLNWFSPTELIIGYLMSGQTSVSTIAFLDPTLPSASPLLMIPAISLCDRASNFNGEYTFYTKYFPSW